MSIISILLAIIIAATLIIVLMAVTSRKNKAVKTNNGSIPKNKNVIVKECTKKLTQYYNYYTFGDWGVASTYDLCLDSSILGIEGTADFIIEFARKAGKL